MTDPTGFLSPLLTFLSLELVAAGYLVNEVAEDPTKSWSIISFSICYGLSVILSLAYVMFATLPNTGTSGWFLFFASLSALLSVFAYAAGLYFLRD